MKAYKSTYIIILATDLQSGLVLFPKYGTLEKLL